MASLLSSRNGLLCLLASLALAGPALAQPGAAAYKLERVEIGFPLYDKSEGAFKAGLWAPLYVKLVKADDGGIVLPVEKDGVPRGMLTAATNDAEGTQGVYTTVLDLGRGNDATVLTYVQPGTITPEPSLNILAGKSAKYTLPTRAALGGKSALALPMDGNLYLTIGPRLVGFDKAMTSMGGTINGFPARAAAFESDPARLPDKWFGYQAVDLAILLTDTKQIADDFCLPKSEQMESRVAALIDWVRRGGHLVLSVSRQHQEKVQKLLQSPHWQPPFPNVLTANKTEQLARMDSVHQWANVTTSAYPVSADNPATVAVLQPDKSAQVMIAQVKDEKSVPLMVRVPYGLGSVTLVAFELDRAPFSGWEGSQKFWQHLVNELGPKSRGQQDDGMGGGNLHSNAEMDLSTRLHRELDAFNVPMISFGWVALFIFLYILIVGPLDYFILKKVFKRLEWTWITFPAVVIIISVVAYFTAYALKGDQLKINKIDLVDIDMRTYLDAEYKTKKTYANGTTWFSLLSPRIQNYTIGVQPKLDVWASNPAANPQTGEVMVTWMGRPEANDPYGSGKSRSAGLFRRAYEYAPDATGLREVPIPVWTTKSFMASWEAKFDAPPLDIDLYYAANDPNQKMAGTIQNNLPIDLEDVYLFYGNQFFPLGKTIAGAKDGKAEKINLTLGELRASDLSSWLNNADNAMQVQPGQDTQSNFYPTPLVNQLFFFDKLMLGGNNSSRNHALRPLDQSWRLGVLPLRDDRVRTGILVCRFARAEGDTKTLQMSNDPRLPTHLWLGALPGEAPSPPGLTGTMIQDTYIRIIVPVRPKV